MIAQEIVIAKAWRSEIGRLTIFVILCFLSYYLSTEYPESIVSGPLFTIAGYSLVLSLPLFWFLPAITAMSAIYRIYNVRFTIDRRGIEAKTGVLSVHQRITRVRFEDIRSVETEQSILERFLNIGDVEIGTAATGSIEITFQGVAAPIEVQEMVQMERDRRQKLARDKGAQGLNQVNE